MSFSWPRAESTMIGICLHARIFADHFESVPIGQAEIEQNQIGLACRGLGQSLLGSDRFLETITFGIERGA